MLLFCLLFLHSTRSINRMKIKVWLGLGSYIVLYVSKMPLGFSVGDDIFSSNPWLYELWINTQIPKVQFYKTVYTLHQLKEHT